ncbi:MAG: hypothetical protein COB62_01905 [Piscirickettsiaceae bacterium]|nr:MAG: hypothetical protein COB62_01905 [Piscirickettsiaceae bacterium]
MENTLYKILQHPSFKQPEHWQIETFMANETILVEGGSNACIYLIFDGSARVTANIQLDKNTTIHPGFSDVKKHDVFGELAFIDQQPHSTSIVAITDCKIARINNDSLKAFLENHPDYGLAFYKELSKTLTVRLRKTNTKAFSLLAWGLKNQGIEKHLK